MSRGRGGGGRGGRGGFGGGSRGGFGGGLPPMGLSFADIQSMSREVTALYPTFEPLPMLSDFSADEKQICEYQSGFIKRLRQSEYYVHQDVKSDQPLRYSDKFYKHVQPPLKKDQLYAPFFPPLIYDSYFNPTKKRKIAPKPVNLKMRMNLDEMDDEDEKEEGSEVGSNAGSQTEASDYDVEEEYDNDYAEDHFDTGENDDMDNLGDGGGDDGGGGGGDYD